MRLLVRRSWIIILLLFGVLLLGAVACGPGNSPPQIGSLTADPASVSPGEECTLTCVATDPNDTDTLTYTWSYSGPSMGSISGTGGVITWTAPMATGTYTISVTVSDGKGGTVSGTCQVIVAVAETEGSIDVKSIPAGAKVYLDGYDTDNITPFVLTGISEGEHDIRLTLHGYKDRVGTVTVEGGETKYINWQLEEAVIATLTLQPDPAHGKDTYVYAAQPSSANGSDPFLFTGTAGAEICWSFLQFDISAVPAGAVITQARLSLYYINTVPVEQAVDIGIYRITSGSWDEETVNWLGKPESTATAIDINTVPAAITNDWEYWDITVLARSWLDGSVVNDGVLLKAADGAATGAYKAFYASNWGTDGTKLQQCPKLLIQYYLP